MGTSPSDKDLRAEAQDLVEELPDETAAGRMVHDDGTPASADEWLRNRSKAMKGQPGAPSPLSIPPKKNNNKPPNR
ncbi:hypothetical protein GCM10023322_70140 [Rugosimonospora acidiphila]|uniref:Uncharacterized protein n=1 Tax=Rugosimonospora acidiphila TaxID=556531 RepID=A0ABP9SMV2_9ACTN